MNEPVERKASRDKALVVKEVLGNLSRLTEQEQQVVVSRYMRGDTLSNTAKILGVSKERARQIEDKAVMVLASLLEC